MTTMHSKRSIFSDTELVSLVTFQIDVNAKNYERRHKQARFD
jgi:hypothetical protein